MKKFVMAALSLFFFTQCALGFSACNAGKEHEHVFEEEWRHNAQTHWHFCTVPGCNERSSEEAHDEYWELIETTVQPTCFTRGEGKYKCSVCGETKQDYIEPTGEHEWSEWKAAEEYHYKVCAKRELGCTAEEREEHAPGAPLLRSIAREYQDGVQTVSCTVCSQLLEEIITPATIVPHSFKLSIKNSGKFFYFSELDENWHMCVTPNTFYYYVYSEGKTAGDQPTQVFDFDKKKGGGAGVKISLIDMRTDKNYSLLEDMEFPSIDGPATCFDGKLRFLQTGQYKLVFRFTYTGYSGIKETARAEFVADVMTSSDYSAWLAQWQADHPDGTTGYSFVMATPST